MFIKLYLIRLHQIFLVFTFYYVKLVIGMVNKHIFTQSSSLRMTTNITILNLNK